MVFSELAPLLLLAGGVVGVNPEMAAAMGSSVIGAA
jgi:hypothetical protein